MKDRTEKNRKLRKLVVIADAHGLELGPVGEPGNLAFVQLDGTLRPGHDVFNKYRCKHSEQLTYAGTGNTVK